MHVTGRNLEEAVDALHGLQGHRPATPLRLADGITITWLSARIASRAALIWVPGDGADPVDVSRMRQPHRCETCGQVYDETNGGGQAGRCPNCADQHPDAP